MADKNEITIERVFELMDSWRHLPAYQLERRADIFFALFLPEVLRKRFHLDQDPILIPEFPVKRKRENNLPSRIDYLALECRKAGEFGRGFLVELKTDMGSRREDQDRLLHRAASRGMKCLLKELLEVCGATSERPKYICLLSMLNEIGLIEWDGKLPMRQGFSKALEEIRAKLETKEAAYWPELSVVYVQPRRPEPADVVDFCEFADKIKKRGEIGSLFARHLKEWASTDAGSPNPKDLPPC